MTIVSLFFRLFFLLIIAHCARTHFNIMTDTTPSATEPVAAQAEAQEQRNEGGEASTSSGPAAGPKPVVILVIGACLIGKEALPGFCMESAQPACHGLWQAATIGACLLLSAVLCAGGPGVWLGG